MKTICGVCGGPDPLEIGVRATDTERGGIAVTCASCLLWRYYEAGAQAVQDAGGNTEHAWKLLLQVVAIGDLYTLISQKEGSA